MTILAIKTDQPGAELWLYDDQKEIAHIKWQAHRQLAETIHQEIEGILNKSSITLGQVEGLICYKGPGSFTGLRIGLTTANALAYSLNVPVVSTKNKNWLKTGINDLMAGKNEKISVPYYDHPAITTSPKK